MSEDAKSRRAALRETLVALAEAQIAAGGPASLRARALAQEAGCAVGAIYTVFDDLTALVLAVNARTAARLDAALRERLDTATDLSPTERLIVLSYAYLGFAARNHGLWQALFAPGASAGTPPPDRHAEMLAALDALIGAPLGEVFPDLPPRECDLMRRAVLSSIHGIVHFGLEGGISDAAVERSEDMLAQLLTRIG